MINFAAWIKQRQLEEGYCTLADKHFPTVYGWRTDCRSGQVTLKHIHWRVDMSSWKQGAKTVHFLNGVTGFEEFNFDDLVEFVATHKPGEDFPANAGTPNRYDGLNIHYPDLAELVKEVTTWDNYSVAPSRPTHLTIKPEPTHNNEHE